MGLFTKRSQTHFNRDEMGNVTSVEHYKKDVSGGLTRVEPVDEDLVHKSSYEEKQHMKHLEDEYYKREKKKPKKGMGKVLLSAGKSVDKAIVRYNRSRNPMRGNYNPWGSMFDMGMPSLGRGFDPFGSMGGGRGRSKPRSKPKSKDGEGVRYVIRGGVAYPVAKSKGKKKGKKKSSSSRRGGGMGGFDMMDNWRFMK